MIHYTANLANALAHDASISVVTWKSEEAQSALDPQIRYLPITRSASSWARRFHESLNPRFYSRVAHMLVRNVAPDVVHLIYGGFHGWPLVRQLCADTRPLVYTLHDPVPHEEQRNIQDRVLHFLRRWWDRKLLTTAAVIHIHSLHYQRVLLAQHGTRYVPRLVVIPHGGGTVPASIACGRDIPPELHGRIKSNKTTFLLFGRLQPYKGLSQLRDAINLLSTECSAARVIIAGQGVAHDLDSLGTAEVVLINRFIPDAEIRSLFASSDVVVLPYLSATQSGVVPLAYYFAKPVIATDVGTLREYVKHEHTGFIVRRGDPQALASAMKRFIQDPLLAKAMGECGQRWYATTYSWSKVAQQFLQAYEQAALTYGKQKPI